MGTRSMIGYEQEDGSYLAIYCHYDGYINYNGAILFHHYTSIDKVIELVNMGDISVLGANIHPDPNKPHTFDNPQKDVVVAYKRDRGDKYREAGSYYHKSMFDKNYYIYIMNKDGKWIVRFPIKRDFYEMDEEMLES